MNKYRIENPNSNNELDYKSSSTLRTNPARRKSTIYTFGQMQDAKGIVENGKYTLSSAKIVIYEGTINQYAEDVISTGQFSSNEIMNSTINNNQIIGAVAAHESVHTTSENLKIQKEGGDAEKGPNEIESQVLKETKELNKKNNE